MSQTCCAVYRTISYNLFVAKRNKLSFLNMAVLSNKNNVPISERKCTSYRTDLHNPQAKGKTFKK